MAIWDAIKELEKLQRKAAKGKDIEDSDTFIVRAALKEKGWEGLVCEEAISRGYKEHRGEKIGIPSWFKEIVRDIVQTSEDKVKKETGRSDYDHMLTPPEVQRSETTEEEPKVPGRVFNLLGNLGEQEPGEPEEVHKEGPKVSEHVAYLNGLSMMRTGNPYWGELVLKYMKDYGLKPSDMEGLVGPKPWLDEPLCFYPDEEELFEPIKKEETMEPEGLKGEQEKIVAGTRQRVFVGDEIGWLCKHCNRVWSLDEKTCSVCKQEPNYETLYPAAKQAADKVIAEALGKKKTNKELATEAMRKALCLDKLEEDTGLTMDIVQTEEDGTVQCDFCGASDYLECDCCIECESEECVCCDNCARFPCQCDKEECPICHKNVDLGEPCPHGCDAEMTELQVLYEDVKNSTDLGFAEKVKFMTLLKQKMELADDLSVDDPKGHEVLGEIALD